MPVRLTPTITLYTRADWKARKPRGEYVRQASPQEGFVHHSTDRLAEYADTLAEQKAIARAIQRYHMDANGWLDIGYAYLVFQAYGNREYARIFEGRPVNAIPAAQAYHNTGTLPVCVVGNFQGDDKVKANTRHAIRVLLNQHPSIRVLGGHRDVVPTSCPGDTLYDQIARIARAANLAVYPHRRAPLDATDYHRTSGPDTLPWTGDPAARLTNGLIGTPVGCER